ncbi:MAG: T9SS type A sorting domain-containing protein [Chitinophagales bacterium]
MKKTFTLFLSCFIAMNIFAQTVSDSVNMNTDYSDDVFYSFENSTVATQPLNDWTIALSVPSQRAGIFINEGAGVDLWVTGADTADFATVDTTGMTWDNLYNNPKSFEFGAYSDLPGVGQMSGSGQNQKLSYGWGSYFFASHLIFGEEIFIIKTLDGDYFKTFMQKREQGEWYYRVASLDNAFDSLFVINSSTYTDQNFVYLNLDDNELAIDRDPVNTTWDLQFTRMALPFPAGQKSTTVFLNEGISVAEVNNELSTNAVYNEATLADTLKNIIGDDWKTFDFMGVPPSFVIDDSLSWFVKDRNDDVYHLIFTEVEGFGTGKIHFTTEKVASVAINEIEAIDFQGIYPNPAQDVAYLILSAEKSMTNLSVQVINIIGATMHREALNLDNGMTQIPINLANFEQGIYFVTVTDGKNTNTQKLIVK